MISKPLTVNYLREILHYDGASGSFTWKVSPCNSVPCGSLAGSPTKDGYVKICIDRRFYRAHRLAWFYVYGVWPTCDLDHKDTVRSNNSINNLREATDSQNGANARRPINNKSGYKGVCFNKKFGLWQAYIMRDGRQRTLGYYNAPEKAHNAYIVAAKQFFGEFARAE